jgi:GNAT superfamily N-acetyltransferase
MLALFFITFKKNTQMLIKELTTIEAMVAQLEIIQFLYPNMTIERYTSFLQNMIPHNYKQVAVFEDEVCIGLTGYWLGTKLWTGKYLEIDNFIVHPNHRQKGIGKTIAQFIDNKAKEINCTCIVLDAYTENFTAHRFYYNLGYVPRGFHFIKTIDQNGFS